MRYRESKDRSAELLRLTLPLMAQQSAAYHPHSYTIWYEHTAGINPRLSSFLEQSLKKGVTLGDEDIWRLYTNYVIARDAEAMERMQQQIQAILTDTANAASTAEQEATQFSQTLVSHRNQLQEPTAQHQLPTIVSELIAETERMRVVAEDLSEQLERSAQKVSELTEQLEQAEHQALLDPLTQLLNRRGFEQRLRAYIQDHGSINGAVMLVADIDHFKTINDTYGHVLGDKVIRSVAEVICGNIKGRDVAARIGGEEFAIFLPDTGVAGATALANHIRAAMGSRTIRRSGLEKPVDRVTLSVGIAAASPQVQTVEALLDCADKAMYAGKRAGRNRVEVFELSDSPAIA